MKKLLIIVLMVVLILPMAFSSCAETTPAEPVELRLATQTPPGARLEAYEEWARQIGEATDGEVTVTIYPAASLIGVEDMLTGIKSGLADVGDLGTALFPEQYPLLNILSLPFMSMGDKETTYRIKLDLEEKFPELEAEFSDFKVLYITGFGDGGLIHTTEVPVRVPEDLKGLQILSIGAGAQVMNNIGASPAQIMISDLYTSLDRGLLDAVQTPWWLIHDMGVYEFLPNHSVFPSIAILGIDVMVMNLDTWNSLSSKAQQAFDDVSADMTEKLMQIETETDETVIAIMEEEGHNFIMITPEEEELWFNAAEPIHREYLAMLDAMGLPATEIYEEALRLAAQYK